MCNIIVTHEGKRDEKARGAGREELRPDLQMTVAQNETQGGNLSYAEHGRASSHVRWNSLANFSMTVQNKSQQQPTGSGQSQPPGQKEAHQKRVVEADQQSPWAPWQPRTPS